MSNGSNVCQRTDHSSNKQAGSDPAGSLLLVELPIALGRELHLGLPSSAEVTDVEHLLPLAQEN